MNGRLEMTVEYRKKERKKERKKRMDSVDVLYAGRSLEGRTSKH